MTLRVAHGKRGDVIAKKAVTIAIVAIAFLWQESSTQVCLDVIMKWLIWLQQVLKFML